MTPQPSAHPICSSVPAIPVLISTVHQRSPPPQGGLRLPHQPHMLPPQAWCTPFVTPYLFQELNMPISDAQVASAVPWDSLRCLRRAKIIFNIHHENLPHPQHLSPQHTPGTPPLAKVGLLPVACYLRRHFSGTLGKSCLCSGSKLWGKNNISARRAERVLVSDAQGPLRVPSLQGQSSY